MNTQQAQLVLTGDGNIPAMPLTDAEVNHLRRLLAWMRVEYMLDENSQAGFLEAAAFCIKEGLSTEDRVNTLVEERGRKINQVPKYLRQGIKMLTKKLHAHDRNSGIVDHTGATP